MFGLKKKSVYTEPTNDVFTEELMERREHVKSELLKDFRISYVKNIIGIVEKHREILLTKQKQHCYVDEYGIEHTDEFIKDLYYFILNVIPHTYKYENSDKYQRLEEFKLEEYEIFAFSIKPKLISNKEQDNKNFKFGFDIKNIEEPLSMFFSTINIILILLETIIVINTITTDSNKNNTTIKNPLDYEQYIANKLKNLGFNAHTTKASGDQGADVLADKNKIKFAIQCKMYNHPVGNKAVQEVNTARDFYNCDYAVVVTNSTYTKSARSVANTCGVILLHESELNKLLKYTK